MKIKNLTSRFIRIFFLLFIVVAVSQIIFWGVTFTTIFNLGILMFLAFLNIVDVIYSRYEYMTLKKLRNILIVCFMLFCFSFIVVESVLSTELNSNIDMNQDIDYVIILGAGLNGDKVSKRLEGRLEKGLEYLREKINVKVIVSGGQGKDELISEAEAMGSYLTHKGISKDRIIYEDKSTSTIENIYFSKRIINKDFNDDYIKILIVTSDYHMFRAKMICKKLGFKCFGITSKSSSAQRVNYMIREYFAVIKDWIYLNFKV